MNRLKFLKNSLGLGLVGLLGCQIDSAKAKAAVTSGLEVTESIPALRQKLIAAWHRSETMTMTNIKQMPQEFFKFKYTPEAMSFAEQWRHCVIYTCGQIAGRSGLPNPYSDIKLPVQMTKKHVIKEMENMYNWVRESIEKLTDEKLMADCEFAGDTIPVWRLFYAMENHIIHHRGQCVVYLRLNGVKPKGYYGW